MSTVSNKDIDDILEGTRIKANTVITQDDELSELDNDDDTISKQAEEVFVNNEFKQHVISFVKYDDMIRERKQEIKELTNDKKPCEEFIIKFLEAQEESAINLNGQRIIKNQSCTKTALKMDMIKEAILDEIKKLEPEDKARERLDKIMTDMDEKRPTKTRANLKRTFDRQKTQKMKAPPKSTLKKLAEKFNDEVV
jgi:hypothetical protein